MVYQTIPIEVNYKKAGLLSHGFTPTLHTYVQDRPDARDTRRRPALIICPGGGYEFTADHEAEPVALRFVAMGYQCFVLRYSVAPMLFPGALLELGEAVRLVRAHADEWDIDPTRVFVCGFSAGGHLAGSLGVFWNRDFVKDTLRCTDEHRPSGMILCCPVITSGEAGHRGSFERLLGERYEELHDQLSLEKQVSADTPPAFLWHTVEDDCVPVENPLLFAQAMRAHGRPFELHIFPKGPHGISLSDESISPELEKRPTAIWPQLADNWMKRGQPDDGGTDSSDA